MTSIVGSFDEPCLLGGSSYGHQFEGPEKRLEVHFKFLEPAQPETLSSRSDFVVTEAPNTLGLESISEDKWQELLDFAKCTIISRMKNEHFTAYVLSESSLFVYPTKFILKTCGTTTLLNTIPKLLEYSASCKLKLQLVKYSRKNFLYPDCQHGPHTHFDHEVEFLNNFFEGGQAFTMGSLTGDHWNLYIADYHDHPIPRPQNTIEFMMHGMDPDVCQEFYWQTGRKSQDKLPGIADLVPGSDTDEYNFEPCGYSMNGLRDEAFWTIHVTPEQECSYASFETNAVLPCYNRLAQDVLNKFKPATITLAIYSEKNHPREKNSTNFDWSNVSGYKVKSKTINEINSYVDVVVGCLVRE